MRRLARLLRLCPFTAIWAVSFLVLVLMAWLGDRVDLPVVSWLLQILVIPAYVSALAVLLLAKQLFGSLEPMPTWFELLNIPLRVLPFIALDLGLAAWRRITDRPLTLTASLVALLALVGGGQHSDHGFPNVEASRVIAP